MNMIAISETSPLDGHAAALANITKMVDDLTEAQAVILQLRADLHRAEDRLEMVSEERNKYRADAELLRNKLLSICTTVANIGLMTRDAEAVVMAVNEHAMIEHQEFKQGNEAV